MNNIEYYKNEMLKRYCYINEHSKFLFSVNCKNDLSDELRTYKEITKKVCLLNDLNKIDIKLIDSFSLFMLESLLFEDKPLEETEGFVFFEKLLNDPLNINISRNGLDLKNNFNKNFNNEMLYFDTIELLNRIYENIARQSNDFSNKEKKLKIIDEYIRIAKYSNDGVVWRGGYYLNNIDKMFNPINYRYYVEGKDLSLNRFEYDVGIKSNSLIETTKDISFSEKEKQKIYLKYHDEIPHDLNILCSSNGILEIDRPEFSKPCNREIKLKEQYIFSSERDEDYVFLTLCPSCLYIVGVKANLIPESMQEDIVWKNKKDPLIYKESYLQSEIKSLSKFIRR